MAGFLKKFIRFLVPPENWKTVVMLLIAMFFGMGA